MDKFKNFFNCKCFKNCTYFLSSILIIFILIFISNLFDFNKLLGYVELKSLDIRFAIKNSSLKPNPKIVILSIDDTSMDVLQGQFGRWPWSRDHYSKIINYLESGKVDQIFFDLMFIGNQKGHEYRDLHLAKTISKYPNVYTAMNFDYKKAEGSPVLSDKLTIQVEDKSKFKDYSNITFSNCRLILNEILKSTSNIGIINLTRDEDGISRRSPIFFSYQNAFYPYLAFKGAIDYLKKHENLNIDKFVINSNNDLVLGHRKIHLDKDKKMIINWYDKDDSFEYMSFWKIVKSIENVKEGKEPIVPASFFKDKIVFIGITATSLFDIKTTPIKSIYPGVELLATVYNNILDNNSIKKTSNLINMEICFLLCLLIGFLVAKSRGIFISVVITLLISSVYIFLANFLFQKYNLWIEIVNPLISIILTFTVMFVFKYFRKSKDFEYTYKLATTDGLTNLHNHRYFQEYMQTSIERTKRYNKHFSLILVDIDFFKKFNDTYGHQAGDAVLRQVANVLKKSVRTTDLVARYGGEEMAIVVDADEEEAMNVADKICKIIADTPFYISEIEEKQVTISLGVATYPQDGEISSELIEFADKGLYMAKRNGRNQVGKINNYNFN